MLDDKNSLHIVEVFVDMCMINFLGFDFAIWGGRGDSWFYPFAKSL